MAKHNHISDLTLVRESFPATTAAAHTVMMQAQELHRSKQQDNWVDFNGKNLSKLRFEGSVANLLSSAQKETGKEDPRELLAFVESFLNWFTRVSYGFDSAYDEIQNRELKADEVPGLLKQIPAADPSRYAPLV